MSNHGCNVDGTVNDLDYSSPVPVIGFYVAAASLICLGLMLYDITAAKLAAKPWLPCKWFALNSVTLTLLSVVSKLPVDLTTAMPSRQDQLSKLTGTAVICISMGFFSSSLGVNSESECSTNLLALSIFVITVSINICLQLYTGVIGLFIPEHIIVLGLMLLLLVFLWNISSYTKDRKRIRTDECNNILRRGNRSMFGRLKLCCLYTYCINPQFEITMQPMNAAVGSICAMCSVIVIQATFRSVILNKVNLCDGHSDYGWSMTPIVVIQILTIIVGSSAVVFRWLKLFRRMEFERIFEFPDNHEDTIKRNRTLRKGLTLSIRLQDLLAYLNWGVTVVARLLVWSWVQVRNILGLYINDTCERFEHVQPRGLISAGDYIVQKGVEDMIRLMKVSNDQSLTRICQYLSQRNPSQRVRGMEIRGEVFPIKVCSLSIAFLVKVAQVSMPKEEIEPLLLAFAEASEVIHFIDKTIQPKTSENFVQLSYAKALGIGGDFTCLVPPDNGRQPGIDPAIAILVRLREALSEDEVWSQLCRIIDFINPQKFSSKGELFTCIEELFVDLMHGLFAQLPVAIFKSLSESPSEQFEDRVRLAMRFLLQTGYLGRVRWSFPIGFGISSFVKNEPQQLRNLNGPLAKYWKVVPSRLPPAN